MAADRGLSLTEINSSRSSPSGLCTAEQEMDILGRNGITHGKSQWLSVWYLRSGLRNIPTSLLKEHLKDKDPDVRALALEALAEQPSFVCEEYHDILVHCLNEEASVQEVAMTIPVENPELMCAVL
ncbi:hypothetical protein ETB97_011607 [Aspergillus alliaceus]|uniref:HEAT repeat domain-containing protein n=1 Tax=Petromyces alliaceus TaxID=209559 RepID=A0A8H6A6D9_PETAA|nr:hypothetical protein ETB97_011607 [Aspergillus burnettii]